MSTYGDQDWYPGVNDTDEDDTDYIEEPIISYMAFAVEGDTMIDIERYREWYDWDTNATDYIYDGERITLNVAPITNWGEVESALVDNGWVVIGGGSAEEFQYQATVERI